MMQLLWLLATVSAFVPGVDGSAVTLAQLQLPNTLAPARVRALDAVSAEVARRTSVSASPRSQTVSPAGDDLFDFPLLFLPVNDLLASPGPDSRTRLGHWLKSGGALIIDWQGGGARLEQFRESVETFLAAVLPGATLERIPRTSVLYRSFYRLGHASGRLRLVDDLYGVMLEEGRIAVVVCFNDLLSAAERDKNGEFRFDVVPGGPGQREDAVRLLVNLVVYGLCLDYKDDKVHLEYLKSRRNWRWPGEDQ